MVNTAGIAKSYRFKVENGSSVESNPVFIVDGVQVSEIESLDPDQIESMSVIKGTNLPGEFADKGYEGVITIKEPPRSRPGRVSKPGEPGSKPPAKG